VVYGASKLSFSLRPNHVVPI